MPCVWNDWLPPALSEEIRTEEPRRFARVIQALAGIVFGGEGGKADHRPFAVPAHPPGHAAGRGPGRQRGNGARSVSVDRADRTDRSDDPPADRRRLAPEVVSGTLPYVPLVKGFLDAKAEPGLGLIQVLTSTLLAIVLSAEADLSAQARWGSVLQRVLRTHGRRLKKYCAGNGEPFQIEWFPLYAQLRRHYLVMTPNYEGAGVMEARRQALVHLLHQSRRFFPEGSAMEIWEYFRPALRDPHSSEAFEAVGWMCMMLPTQEICSSGLDAASASRWQETVDGWLCTWGQRVHNQTWQSLWFGLLARLAKHDVHGVIDWTSNMRGILNRFLWAFHVPLGPASASPPFRAGAPAPIEALFANDMLSRSASTAKVIMWSIGREDVRVDGAGADGTADVALSCLENIVDIFEQYYHPSNGGKWSGSLALFLRNLCDNFCKRLVAEHSVMVGTSNALHSIVSGGESEEEPSDDEDQDDDEDGSMSGTGEAGVDSSLSDDDMVGISLTARAVSAPQNAHHPRRHLSPHHRQAVVRLLLRLALKGQSGKDSSMRRYSSGVLSMLACVEPRIVLPEVQRHFFTALDMVTAARQYGNAIQTLSLCVRPMLLCGKGGLDVADVAGDGDGTPAGTDPLDPMDVATSVNIYESISSAMIATLPGIDANDPPKSLAVFRLYCCVLSCVGPMQADADPYSMSNLYSEEWATELLSRIFAVIANVDSPDGGIGGGEHSSSNNKNDDGSSFLLDGNSMFRPLMELLFARLPEPFRTRTIKHTSEFLLGSTFSSVAPEAAILCNAMAWADPDETEKHMLAPLVSMLLEECESIRDNSKLSKVQETTLCWRIGLLSSLVYHMGPQATRHGERIKSIFSVILQSPSTTVHGAASRCLSSLLVGLCSYYPLRQYETCCVGDPDPASSVYLEPFVDKFGEWDLAPNTADIPAPAWHEPSDAEIALSNDFLATFLEAPSDRILEAASAPSHGISKLEMRSIMVTLEGCLEGTRSCLPDFEGQHLPALDESACVVGRLGATVGSGALRSKVGQALIAASKMIQSNDVETLMYLMRVLDCLLSVGCAEFLSSDSSASAWASDDKWLQQPSVSGFLLECGGDRADGADGTDRPVDQGTVAGRLVTWRRRRPRWIAIEKVFMNLEWRASQRSYRSFASVTSPLLAVDRIPKVYVDALGLAVHYMLHGGSHVRDVSSNVVEKCAKRYPLLSKHISASVCAGIAKLPEMTSFDVNVSCVELLPQLTEAAHNSALRAAEAAASGVPESEEEQSIGAGAAGLLRWISSWRYFTRNYHGLRAIVLALISSFAYQGPDAQISMTMAQLMLALRSMRPTDDPSVADLICMDCFNVVRNARDGISPVLSGKHETITILFPLYLLPDISPGVAAKLVDMYAHALVSDAPLVRRVSHIALEMMLLPMWKPHEDEAYSSDTPQVSAEAVAAARESLASILDTEGETLLPKFMQMLSTSHHNMASSADDGQTQRMRGIGAGKEETIVAAALNTLLKGLEWPVSTAGFKAITQGSFTVRHARLTQVLTQVNPGAVLKHLKAPVEEALCKSQDADKPAVAAAAEVLAGILASGCFVARPGEDGTDSDAGWVLPALQRGLEGAPLDFLNVWGDCVLRFGINGLKEKTQTDDGGIRAIVDTALSNKTFAESLRGPPSDVFKRVTYFTEILQEVLGDATGKFPVAPVLGQMERQLLSEVLTALPTLIETGCDTDMARQAIAGLTADACMVVMTMASADEPGMIKMSDLKAMVDGILDAIYAQFDAAADYLYVMNKDKAVNDAQEKSPDGEAAKLVLDIVGGADVGDVATAADVPGMADMVGMKDMHNLAIQASVDHDSSAHVMDVDLSNEEGHALAHVAFVCELTYQFLAGASADTTPLLIKPLRNIMRVLELIPSEAQFVGSTVRLSLRSAKYQPLEPEFIEPMLSCLIESMHGELWTERAAALQFLQYFWFRNAINMGEEGSERVLNEAMRLLEDSKLEVREMACDTISGVIRALSAQRQATLRAKIVDHAKAVFPARKRRRLANGNGSANGAGESKAEHSLQVRHGAVLGLRALAMSSPYEIPKWLPGILMSLVRVGTEKGVVGRTVTECLSDFRRTHESLDVVKSKLSEEEWEAIRDVAVGGSSYFV